MLPQQVQDQQEGSLDTHQQTGGLTCMPPHRGYQCAPFVMPPGNSSLLAMRPCASAYTLARWMKAASSGLLE